MRLGSHAQIFPGLWGEGNLPVGLTIQQGQRDRALRQSRGAHVDEEAERVKDRLGVAEVGAFIRASRPFAHNANTAWAQLLGHVG